MFEKTPPKNAALKTLELGVYKVTLEEPSNSWDPWEQVNQFKVALPLIRRLASEIYAMEPLLAVIYVLSQFWDGIEAALLLYLASRLLKIIEIGLIEGKTDSYAIFNALAARLICLAFTASLRWGCGRILPRLSSRITTHFELYLMQANLRVDVPTAQEPRSSIRASSQDAWRSFEDIVRFCVDATKLLSQLVLIVQASQATGSPFFAAMCLIKPVIASLGQPPLWYTPHITYIANSAKKRMNSLSGMTRKEFRSEVIGGSLTSYIIDEYKKAANLLGSLSDEGPGAQMQRTTTPLRDIVTILLGDLPIAYCALQAILHPTKFSISQVAILQQSSSMLESALDWMIFNVQNFRQQCQEIQSIYEADKIKNILTDGEEAYPRTEEEKSKGMSFELRKLAFTYPGSQATEPTLKDVNLIIKSGQLVVIVGANGSGKSTILKLLNRLYDPTSGPESILVDGLPISQYHMKDLHEATATLTQDHHMFPLSLGENIGLGNTSLVHDMDKITEAAELGGATQCIQKLDKKFDTILDAQNQAWGHAMPEDSEHPLNVELESLEKNIEVSGGEKQRLVASRTFMRFTTGKIKYVAVDEPSSALDPEGEVKLFENLIKAREGKTMIFVTHRFGYLTKFADMIVCMKDGTIAEAGTHDELMTTNGEYAKLYRIQANAFTGVTNS